MGVFDNILHGDQSLFKNDVALDFDYIPKLIPHRENEQKHVATCIKPLFSSRNARNLFITGGPGIGKTVACRHVLKEMEEQTDDIFPVYVNCWQKNTSHKVVLEICEQIGYKFTQNKKTDELFKIIAEMINKNSAVFVFDEIDKAEDLDFLYTILESIYRKCIILITNYKIWLVELDERIKSRLTPEMLEFKEYTLKETVDIIKQRAEQAFVQGVWDPKALETVAAKAAAARDIRTGLFLLKEAALIAEERSNKKVAKEHVEKALEKMTDFSIKKSSDLEDETKFILEVVRKNDGKKIGDLYREYKKAGGKSSYKTFQRKIAKLDQSKFISLKKQTGTGGNTTIVNKKITDF
ncbi:MAG: AAA family ATPase [archaeon]